MPRLRGLLFVAAVAAPAAGLAVLEDHAAAPGRLGSAPAPPMLLPRRSAAAAASALRLRGGAPAAGAPSFLPGTWSRQDMAAAAYLGWGVLAHFFLQVQVRVQHAITADVASPSHLIASPCMSMVGCGQSPEARQIFQDPGAVPWSKFAIGYAFKVRQPLLPSISHIQPLVSFCLLC